MSARPVERAWSRVRARRGRAAQDLRLHRSRRARRARAGWAPRCASPWARRRVAGWVVERRRRAAAGRDAAPDLGRCGAGARRRRWSSWPEWAAWRWAGPGVGASCARRRRRWRCARLPADAPAAGDRRPRRRPAGRRRRHRCSTLGGGTVVCASAPAGDPWPLVLGGGAPVLRRRRRRRRGARARPEPRRRGRGGAAGCGAHGVAGGAAARATGPQARAGGCVAVGTRAAAFAPLPRLAAAVVLDAHDEAYHEERAPTWAAWEVVAERARRDGAPCALVSPCPTLELLAAGPAGRRRRAPSSAGAGPRSRSSTAGPTTPGPGCSPSVWCDWCVTATAVPGGGWCASSTGPGGCDCWRVRRAASWRAASAAAAAVELVGSRRAGAGAAARASPVASTAPPTPLAAVPPVR